MSAGRAFKRHMGRETRQRPRPGFHPVICEADWAPDPEKHYATTPSWARTEAEIPAARNQTHDVLLQLMGDRRTSGVRWLTFTDYEALGVCERAISDTYSAPSPDLVGEDRGGHLDAWRRIRGLLREHGGFLVLALAEGEQP